RIPDLVSKGAKLANFVICQLGKIRFGRNLDRAARYTGEFAIYVIFVTEQVLGEEDGGRDVAVVRKTKQSPAHRHPALGFSTIHDLTEPLLLTPALDRLGADFKERGHLLVGRLHSAELFEFREIDLHFRARHRSPLPFEQTQFPVPVREGEAQSVQIGIASQDFRLDGRDLAAASRDSCQDSCSRVFDLRERPAIAVELSHVQTSTWKSR